MLSLPTLVIYSFAFAIPALYLTYRRLTSPAPTTQLQPPTTTSPRPQKTIMSAPRSDFAPPKDDTYTPDELKKYDGTNPNSPVYVAIKGTIFDVSHKREVYGPGGSYGVFAGKDASKGLGMSSLKPEHAVADYSGLGEKERQVLDDWYSFFEKRYNIVGKVVDPAAVEPSV